MPTMAVPTAFQLYLLDHSDSIPESSANQPKRLAAYGIFKKSLHFQAYTEKFEKV